MRRYDGIETVVHTKDINWCLLTKTKVSFLGPVSNFLKSSSTMVWVLLTIDIHIYKCC
jgi:hypothetical protein